MTKGPAMQDTHTTGVRGNKADIGFSLFSWASALDSSFLLCPLTFIFPFQELVLPYRVSNGLGE